MREPGDREGTRRDAGPKDPLAGRPLSQPHPDRLPPGHPTRTAIIRAHDEALRTGADTYVDPVSGLVVFTAGCLARRGFCCGSGCRHCPYLT